MHDMVASDDPGQSAVPLHTDVLISIRLGITRIRITTAIQGGQQGRVAAEHTARRCRFFCKVVSYFKCNICLADLLLLLLTSQYVRILLANNTSDHLMRLFSYR